MAGPETVCARWQVLREPTQELHHWGFRRSAAACPPSATVFTLTIDLHAGHVAAQPRQPRRPTSCLQPSFDSFPCPRLQSSYASRSEPPCCAPPLKSRRHTGVAALRSEKPTERDVYNIFGMCHLICVQCLRCDDELARCLRCSDDCIPSYVAPGSGASVRAAGLAVSQLDCFFNFGWCGNSFSQCWS